VPPGNPSSSDRYANAHHDAADRMILDVDIPRDNRAPWHARRAVERLGDQIDPEVAPDVMLLVSELVTNSVKYGERGELRLQIEANGPRKLRVEVIDQGDGFVPVARDRPMNEPGGWGLHLVEALTDRWGVYEGSTHVWFEIDR
jgi:anti-sigma regulatory factor (Ser/Thr protein kinase)